MLPPTKLSKLPAKWRNVIYISGLTVILAIVYIVHYIYTKTPIPVYALDKLNLRAFTLPNLSCNRCNNFTVKFLVHEKAKCELDEDIFLLNFLITFSPNVRARNVVRNGWGGVKDYKGFKVKTIFVFGVHPDKNFNKQVIYEHDKYGDTVQGNFTDDYYHLTEKTMMTLDWINKFCPQAKYVLKTDDDSFNNIYRIIDYLKEIESRDFVGGYCFTVLPDRRKSSKYFISESLYPDKYYPTYCAGPGYILSQGAITAIIKVAPNVRYLPMEDVFVAGMCREVAGIPYTNIPGMVISQDMSKCELATFAKNAHNVVPENQDKLWKKTLAANSLRDCGISFSFYMVIAILLCVFGWIKAIKFFRKNKVSTKTSRDL